MPGAVTRNRTQSGRPHVTLTLSVRLLTNARHRVPGAVRPVPFPISRSRSDWEQFVSDLSRGWGGGWTNPAPKPRSGGRP